MTMGKMFAATCLLVVGMTLFFIPLDPPVVLIRAFGLGFAIVAVLILITGLIDKDR
jgi:hypothetical protein